MGVSLALFGATVVIVVLSVVTIREAATVTPSRPLTTSPPIQWMSTHGVITSREAADCLSSDAEAWEITYTDARGGDHVYTERCLETLTLGDVGDRVELLYDPRNPDRSVLGGSTLRYLGLQIVVVIVACAGVLAIIFVVVVVVARFLERARSEATRP